MDTIDVIKNKMNQYGTTQAFVVEKTGIDADKMSRILNKKRQIQGPELIRVMKVLGLDIYDFPVEPLQPNDKTA